MSEVVSDLVLAFTSWCGGVLVAICIMESKKKHTRGVLLSGATSLALAFGVLYLIFV